jgi:hypothetical protein
MPGPTLPITIQMGALPPTVNWTPQQLADAIVARMSLQTQQTFALFVTGSTEPSSNDGPWLKNGTEWWVWSDTAGAYVPITVPAESLGYYVGDTAPDPTTTFFWIETTAGGSPLALKIYYSGAWTDVYAATLASYLTIAAAAATYLTQAAAAATYLTQANAASTYAPLVSPALTGTPTTPTAAPGTNTTQAASTAFVTAAIAAIPAPSAFAAYPAQGTVSNQVIAVDGNPHKIEFNGAAINPAPAPFDTALFRYVAPANGIYDVSFSSQFDNVDGTPASMQVNVLLYKNGTYIGNQMADLDSTPSPVGSRWSPGFSGLVSLAATDYLEVFVEMTDGVDTGDMTLSAAQLSVHRASA